MKLSVAVRIDLGEDEGGQGGHSLAAEVDTEGADGEDIGGRQVGGQERGTLLHYRIQLNLFLSRPTRNKPGGNWPRS